MLEADGTETREEVAGAIATVGGVVGIVILTKPGISRVHSSRRFMEYLQGTGSTLPVVHHLVFDETMPEEQLVIVGSCDVGAADGRPGRRHPARVAQPRHPDLLPPL